ncbi:MAG: MobV family relaxase, partial [Clostridia bacterium]
MSYAIIRNTNYKMKNLSGIYRHNERKNTNYSNKEINKQKSKLNYSIKAPYSTYEKIFKDIKNNYNLQGMIKKVSNVMCEFIITSDKEFFNSIGEQETKRYFQTAYKFVENYNNLGEDFIVSAKVHLDENTPHLHILFIPVVHKKDKNGNSISKIACSEYWKGKDSYRKLQDNFYSYMIKSGFDLERGNKEENEHIPIEKLKKVTN